MNPDIEIEIYQENKTYDGIKNFCCNLKVIDDFVKNKNLTKQTKQNYSKAYVLFNKTNSQFIGFYTISNYSFSNKNNPESKDKIFKTLPANIPCIRLIMLGVDESFQGKKYGSKLLNHLFNLTLEIKNKIGCYGIYLEADKNPKTIKFYHNIGFETLKILEDGNHQMFLTIDKIA